MLDRLSPNPGSRRARIRVGRGIGSGRGKTCGRGQKGAGARSGFKRRTWFEGGQMPLARRVPKGGFKNPFRREFQVVNIQSLTRFAEGATVDPKALHEAGLIARPDRPIKILAEGVLQAKLVVRADAVSAAARAKIEAAGGSFEPVSRSEKGKAEAARPS